MRHRLPALLAASALALFACDQKIAPTVTGLQSLSVTMKSPAPDALGGPGMPVAPTEVVFDVRAIDAQGKTFAKDIDVDVYLSYAGNKIGQPTSCGNGQDRTPLATLRLTGGVAEDQHLLLPRAYGVTSLWLEEAPLEPLRNPPQLTTDSHAIGTSPLIYFANPTIPDVQTPLDLAAPTATYCSPFNKRHVILDHATGDGKLVVTSVFINSYVVADTGANYDPKTGKGGFNHLYIFSFGRPPRYIEPGRELNSVSGNISKFVGFTELNFPLQEHIETTPNPTLLPPVIELTKADRQQNLRLLRLVGATVKVTATMCPIDPEVDDWRKYNQIGMNFGDGVCSTLSTFAVALPGKTFGDFDPLAMQGRKITVVGMLHNSSGQNEATNPPTACVKGSDCAAMDLAPNCVERTCRRGPFNFWSIAPREPSDLTVN
ncbi:MAG: hypothetical protein EXR72_16235 [Myxococcales bacterium]|nr:hypothetical protein [Myxococcales bacterium]